jgi:hypothetical protein
MITAWGVVVFMMARMPRKRYRRRYDDGGEGADPKGHPGLARNWMDRSEAGWKTMAPAYTVTLTLVNT